MRLGASLTRFAVPQALQGWAELLEADPPVTTKTAAYTATALDSLVLADATGGAFSVTLPPASAGRKVLTVKRTNAGANAVTLAPAGSDTIEGAASVSLSSQFASRTLQSDGVSTWYILGST